MDSAAYLAKWQTIFSGLVALFTLVYVCINALQLRAMRKSLEQTRRSNEATEKSNEIAERSLEIGKRAWLVASKIEGMYLPTTIDDPLRSANLGPLRITVENLGGVPAVDVALSHKVGLRQAADSLPEKLIPEGGGQPTYWVVGAGRQESPKIPVPRFSREEIALLNARKAFLYAYCEIGYTDCFGKPRKTVACWELGHEAGARWTLAPIHNRLE